MQNDDPVAGPTLPIGGCSTTEASITSHVAKNPDTVRHMASQSALALPPTLRTPRLNLVSPEYRHAHGLFAYGSREDFTTFLDSRPFEAEAEAEQFITTLQNDNRTGKRMYWVAERATDGCAIGTLGLIFPYSPRHRVADFGYGFAPEAWGTGLFAEAAQAVVTQGFLVLGLHRIQVTTRSANARSIKSVEKIGFRREAVLAEFYQEADDKRGDATVLALLAPTSTDKKASG